MVYLYSIVGGFMNTKKKILILVLLGVISLITGFIIMFISSFKKDQNEMNDRIEIIISKYDKFSSELKKTNKTRDSIHKEFLDTIYYDTFEKNDTSYKNKLLEYEESITKVSKDNKVLKEYCNNNIYYSSSDANSKCSAFNLAYEQMINSFVDDINKYNSNITKYNLWLDGKGNTSALKLEKYKTKKTYIDFNNDGDYSGKRK